MKELFSRIASAYKLEPTKQVMKALKLAYNQGKMRGYEAGHKTGFDDGYDACTLDEDLEEQLDLAFQEGYSEGYEDGLCEDSDDQERDDCLDLDCDLH